MNSIEDRVRALGAPQGSSSFGSDDIEAEVRRRRRRRRAGLAGVLIATTGALLVVPWLATREDDSESVRTGPASVVPTTVPNGPLYEADAMVLEVAGRGPELCLGFRAATHPPSCGGPPVIGWDWDDVGWAEQSGDTRWVDVHVVGTWDGSAFTLVDSSFTLSGSDGTEDPETPDFSPACDEPSGDLALNQGDALSLNLPGGAVPTFPGQVALYLTQGPPFVVNVVVTPGNGTAALEQARTLWSGGLCVVERDAPTEAELATVQAEVSAATADGDTPLGPVYVVGADTLRSVVVVDITAVTDEALDYAHQRWGDLVELQGELTPVDGG